MLIATIKVISNEIDMRVYLINKFRTYFNNVLQFHYTDNTEQIDISIFGNLLNEKNIKVGMTKDDITDQLVELLNPEFDKLNIQCQVHINKLIIKKNTYKLDLSIDWSINYPG